MARTMQETEPDTITYQFYSNKDNTKCIVHETYANSDAAFTHKWNCIKNNTSKDF